MMTVREFTERTNNMYSGRQPSFGRGRANQVFFANRLRYMMQVHERAWSENLWERPELYEFRGVNYTRDNENPVEVLVGPQGARTHDTTQHFKIIDSRVPPFDKAALWARQQSTAIPADDWPEWFTESLTDIEVLL